MWRLTVDSKRQIHYRLGHLCQEATVKLIKSNMDYKENLHEIVKELLGKVEFAQELQA